MSMLVLTMAIVSLKAKAELPDHLIANIVLTQIEAPRLEEPLSLNTSPELGKIPSRCILSIPPRHHCSIDKS